jgi:hypothetical protein
MGAGKTLKVAGLLLFMLGASTTVSGPDVAPDGIVALIEVELQELAVNTESLSMTMLLPWEAPKPEPSTDTSYPGTPEVGQTLLMMGGWDVEEVTETPSNVALTILLFAPLLVLTARPMYTFVAMLIVWVVPTCVQVNPSSELYALNVLPLRTTFTQ